MNAEPHTSKLVVALDVPTLAEARGLVERLIPAVHWFKVGLELFTAAGPAAVETVRTAGGDVLLDIKLHDIPRTVAEAVRSASRLGVGMLTLHLAGGQRMVAAAADSARSVLSPPRLLGVTRLTSEGAREVGGLRWEDVVAQAARRGAEWGLDGAVGAVGEVAAVRAVCPAGFLIVTPGIRPAGAPPDDQARVATPAEGVRAGSDFLVVGRPITRARDPLAEVQAILNEMSAAAAN